jgi:aminoglycoside N3'-acetyltransferase
MESVWLPAFNYDLTSTGYGKYQPDSITTGALNSYIWREKSDWKSQDPVFSLVGWGEKPNTFHLQTSELTPYGEGSIFEELICGDTQILSFGLGISDGATFMHMVESNRPQGPMYRYSKNFKGVYDISDQSMNLSINMHCRPAGYDLEYDLPRLNADLIANRLVEVLNPELSIFIGKISNIYDYWLDQATLDPYYLLTPGTKTSFLSIRERLGRDFKLTDFE